jgi:hypothetical protein
LDSGATLSDVATAANRMGARWSTMTVSRIERGVSEMTLPTIVILAEALRRATDQRVTIPDLLAGDELLAITDPGDGGTAASAMRANDLLVFLAGGARADGLMTLRMNPGQNIAQNPEIMQDMPPGWDEQRLSEYFAESRVLAVTDQDQRFAKSVGINVVALHFWALALWGRPFAEERDHRAGTDANAQKRGRVTRDMKQEIAEAYEVRHGNGQ